jgi:membrane protein
MRSSQSSDLPESAKGSHRSLISLLRLAWVDYERDRGRYLAAAMVYYAMVSVVPLCLLLLATLGLLLRVSSIAAAMQEQMLLRIEASFGSHLREIISQLLNTLKRGSLVASAISLVGLVLTASVLFHHLRMTFRAIWKHQPPLVSGPVRVVVRQTVLEKLISFAMVLSAGILLFVVLVLVSVTQWINRLLGSLSLPSGTGWLLTATSLVIAAITFALLLKFLPPVPLRWRDIWFAVLLCSVAWVVTTELLALYAAFFGSSHSAYGVVGGILAVMVLMNTVSQMLFYGAELCKIMATGKRVVH